MNNRVHQGHLARKRFGQNFLNDQFVIDSIVSAINPQKGQAMVEIGPGLAALTEPVGERLDQLTVIELDRDLAARLQTHPFLGPKLTIYQQDAMTFNFGELAEKMGQPLRVFGNLPYNISTPLMFHLFSYTDAIADMHFMLQKEVVNRLVAGPNSKAYGRLSVMAQYYCNVIAEHNSACYIAPSRNVDRAASTAAASFNGISYGLGIIRGAIPHSTIVNNVIQRHMSSLLN